MRLRFQIDDQVVFANITPRKVAPSFLAGPFASKSQFEISFESPTDIADRIHHYIDALGKYHLETLSRSVDGDRATSFSRYFGSDVYVASFYEALGLNLPSLNLGSEPTALEILNLIHPPVAAAAAAAVDHADALALFEACDSAERELARLSLQLLTSKLHLRTLQLQHPAPEAAVMAEAVARVEEHDALCIAQKDIVQGTLLALSPHIPLVQVPDIDAEILPIAPAPILPLGPDGIPACRPAAFLRTQTFRNDG
jgi:hypothetical protein